MKTWNYLSALIIFLAVSCNTSRNTEQNQDKEVTKPNIVLLFTDDHTYEAIGALGNDVVQTPNLDRLVNAGTTFTHAYNMGGWNGAVCVASRAMIISGSYIWRAKERSDLWKKNDTTAISQTWGRLMSEGGYNTYMSGKWHSRDLSDDPAHREIVRKLFADLVDLQKDMGDDLNLEKIGRSL